MTISATLNRWALLGLVASDASYGQVAAETPLQTFPDSSRQMRSAFAGSQATRAAGIARVMGG